MSVEPKINGISDVKHITATLRAARRLCVKLTFSFELRHAMRPNVQLAAQKLQPICCHQHLGGEANNTYKSNKFSVHRPLDTKTSHGVLRQFL